MENMCAEVGVGSIRVGTNTKESTLAAGFQYKPLDISFPSGGTQQSR